MNIGMRVDASAQIGTGHMARCLAFAQALAAAGARVRFIVRNLGIDSASRLRAAGQEVVVLAPPSGRAIASLVPHASWAGVDASEDVEQTAEALADLELEWLVIDHYAFDAEWHAAAGRTLGCRVCAIDDLGDRDLAVDVLIDHNHATSHRDKYHGRLPESVPILGGPSYALLSPVYAGATRHAVREAVRTVGVFMGGADIGGYSCTALEALALAGFEGEVEVVSTRANPELEALQEAVGHWPGARLTLDLPDLSQFFARHDLQIGASGGATWERCCIGAPTLAVVVADNQRHVLDPLAKLDVLWPVTHYPPTAAAIARQLRPILDNPDLRRKLAAAGRKLVDGRGAARAAAHLLTA